MKALFFAFGCVFAVGICGAQNGNLSNWPKLIDKKDAKGARALCAPYLKSKDEEQLVEAHKCLANVVLCENGSILLESDNATELAGHPRQHQRISRLA